MICKLNLPPIFKLYLSSINPTIDIKKPMDKMRLKFGLKLSNNIIENK